MMEDIQHHYMERVDMKVKSIFKDYSRRKEPKAFRDAGLGRDLGSIDESVVDVMSNIIAKEQIAILK
jgi:hypothetical protein